MNVIITEEAEESIRDIIGFLAAKNPSGARTVYGAISVAIDRLDQFPETWPHPLSCLLVLDLEERP